MITLLLIAAPALATTRTVGTDGRYADLADAVAASTSGDTLILAPGTYDGCLALSGQSLTLVGSGGSALTTIDGGGACASAIEMSGGTLRLQGITLTNSGGRGLAVASGSLLARDLVITGAGGSALDGGGLHLDGGSARLAHSMITGNTGSRGGNVFVTGDATVELVDTAISMGQATNGGGIYVDTSSGTVTLDLDGATVSQNGASSAGAGIFLDEGAGLSSVGSTYSDNTGVSTHGVGIYAAQGVAITSAYDTFTGNTASDLSSGYHGGAIYLGEAATLYASGATFEGNHAYDGGAIFQQGYGLVQISDATFTGNTSHDDGGAIHGFDGTSISLTNVDFTGNEALYGSGGAIAMEEVGTLEATDVAFASQTAWTDGGAVYLDYAIDATFDGASFTSNTSTYGGGGALSHSFYGHLTVQDATFDGNMADDSGGAVSLDYLVAEASFEDTSFTDNLSESGDGGALRAERYGDVSLQRVVVTGNIAKHEGGGLYFGLWGDVALGGGTIEDNEAQGENGGGVYVYPSTSGTYDATVTDSTFTSNAAVRHGGGLYAYAIQDLVLDEVSFSSNTADSDATGYYHGGGLYLYSAATVTVSRSLFCANTAQNGAGAFVSQISTAGGSSWTNNLFVENTATGLGGGVYFSGDLGQTFTSNALLANEAGRGGGAYYRLTTTTFTDNIVAWTVRGKGLWGDDATTGSGSTLTYGDWYTNNSSNVGGTFVMTVGSSGNLGVDPGFTDYTADGDCTNDRLWLASSSALTDAGSASILDPDGSTSDIGAYGGPDALAPDADGDGAGDADWGGDDCDDADATVSPGAVEICDGLDQDCDGLTDDDASDGDIWYTDADGDTYGDADSATVECSPPAGGVASGGDCDDGDASVSPAGVETCDGVDEDCDGTVDDEPTDGAVWYTDADWDGAGDDASALAACEAPDDMVATGGDCDDADLSVNPDADEVCDGLDQDCDGQADDDSVDALPWHPDADADGYGDASTITMACELPSGHLDDDSDCDDSRASVHPGAAEVIDDGIDQDCDGTELLSLASLSYGDLVLSEIMIDPTKVIDALGEWFEVANTGEDVVDLQGLVFSDAGTDSYTVSSTVLVAPGQTALFAIKSSAAVNGGLPTPDALWARTTFRFDNTPDEFYLSYAGLVFDRVEWGTAPDLSVTAGASLSLDPGWMDADLNDKSYAWCASTSTYGLGDRGTPDAENDDCGVDPLQADDLSVGDLVLTEVMINPYMVSDALGEWVEIRNQSGLLVDLDGLVLADDGTDQISVQHELVVDDGDVVVLASQDNSATNGGNTAVDYEYVRTTFRLDDTADEIVLRTADGVVIDRIAWTASWDLETGYSLMLDPDGFDATANDDAAVWCWTDTLYGLGDHGTPGSDTEECVFDADGDGYELGEDCDDDDATVYPDAPEVEDDGLDQDCDGTDQRSLAGLTQGDLVLTEIMVDTSKADDALGEWFELYNPTEDVINLDGLKLTDLGTDSYTVSGELLVQPGDYALFVVKNNPATNGGLPTPDYVWTRSPFRFDNNADEIVLSYGAVEFERLLWGPTVGLDDTTGYALSLDPGSLDATANDDNAAWCNASSTYGLGDHGTPGASNDACP